MTDDDSQRDATRASAQTPGLAGKSTQAERDAEARAVLDNMARLRALRLAREAAEPPRPAAKKAPRAKAGASAKSSGKSSSKSGKTESKPQALSDWLASQQTGGRRI